MHGHDGLSNQKLNDKPCWNSILYESRNVMIYSNTRVHGLKYKFVRVVHQFYQNDTQLCKKIGCETVCYY